MQFGSPPRAVDETPVLVLRGERSRSRPLPRRLKVYGITTSVSFVLLVVLAVVQGMVTSNWGRVWGICAGVVLLLPVAIYTIIRRRSRIEVTATQVRLVDGFGRFRSVPISEVNGVVRGTIEIGRQKLSVFAVLVIDKAGRARLRFSHYVDAERLADAIGVPATGRFEDRVPYHPA
jgi:hypothetical protein